MLPLHKQDPTGRFSGRAESYAHYRPDYPSSVIDAILEGLGDPSKLVAADIGAGTGIASRLLAERGCRVIAIEPNAEMRAAGAAHPNVEWREGSGEATRLADGSVSLVTAFQAFHWFEPERALTEFRRILRPWGVVALVWNERDDGDPFTAEWGRMAKELSGDHPANRRMDVTRFPFLEAGLVEEASNVFRHEQRLDLDGLIGRARSTSYLPSEGRARDQMLDRIREIHRRWADPRGCVTFVYRTELRMATRP